MLFRRALCQRMAASVSAQRCKVEASSPAWLRLLMQLTTQTGSPYPLGASVHPQGVNFSVFSKSSTCVELMLFDGVEDTQPARVIRLDPACNRTYHYWHVFVPGIESGRSMATGRSGRSIRTADCASIRARCFWIRTARRSPCPRATAAPTLHCRGTTALQRAQGAPGSAGRVSRHGEDAASSRHRSYSRCGLQPLGGRQRQGPTLCFRGLENAAYYILQDDSGRYADYTGTGNTLNANHPIVLPPGAPILLMGDEVRRTQRGNNNAYCQDNEISWFDWNGLDSRKDIHRFARLLLMLRSRGDLARGRLVLNLNEVLRQARVEWHGVKLGCPDWSDESHTLAFTAGTLDGRFLVHGIVNAYWEPLTFELPPAPGLHQGWRRAIDTFLEPPHDICDSPDAAAIVDDAYDVKPRSLVLLFAARLPGTVSLRSCRHDHHFGGNHERSS